VEWHKILGNAKESIYYADENCVLISGNCKDIIEQFNRPDEIALILTDPPYEFTAKGGGVYKNSKNMEQIQDAGTDKFDFDKYIPRMVQWQGFNSAVNAYFFCNKELVDKYIAVARNNDAAFDILLMRKKRCPPAHNVHYMPDVEYVVFMKSSKATFNGALGTWDGMYSKVHDQVSIPENILHPNQKPIDILKKYIEISTIPGDIVLDPFSGSAQTAIAARDLGRFAICIEINPQFLETAKTNLSQMTLF
jgi:site-specific DNA-methyltransferase (adenine-specific)